MEGRHSLMERGPKDKRAHGLVARCCSQECQALPQTPKGTARTSFTRRRKRGALTVPPARNRGHRPGAGPAAALAATVACAAAKRRHVGCARSRRYSRCSPSSSVCGAARASATAPASGGEARGAADAQAAARGDARKASMAAVCARMHASMTWSASKAASDQMLARLRGELPRDEPTALRRRRRGREPSRTSSLCVKLDNAKDPRRPDPVVGRIASANLRSAYR